MEVARQLGMNNKNLSSMLSGKREKVSGYRVATEQEINCCEIIAIKSDVERLMGDK